MSADQPQEFDREDITKLGQSELSSRSSDLARRGLEDLSRANLSERLTILQPLDSIVLSENLSPVTCASISPSGLRFITGEFDGSVKIWSLSDLGVRYELTPHAAPVTDVSFLGDEATVYSAGLDGVIRFSNIRSGKSMEFSPGSMVTASDVSSDGSTLVAGITRKHQFSSGGYEFDGHVSAWNLNDVWDFDAVEELPEAIWRRELDDFYFATVIEVSPDDRHVLFDGWRRGMWPAYLEVVSVEEGSPRLPTYQRGLLGSPQDATFSHDGEQVIVSAGLAHVVSLFELESGTSRTIELEKATSNEEYHNMPKFGVMDVSRKGRHLALARAWALRYRIYDVEHDWSARSSGIQDDMHVYIYELEGKSRVGTLKGHTEEAMAVIFFHEQPFLLTAGLDATIHIWRLPNI